MPPGGALASHEPTSARKQKRYWRGHWTESVNVLGIGVSELMDTGVEDASPEHSSRADRGVARNPLSEAHEDNESSLHAGHGMVDDQSRHLGHSPSDARGAARNPLSGARCESAASLPADHGVDDTESWHLGRSPSDASGAARTPSSGAARTPPSGERHDGDDPLCANNGAIGCEPRHQGRTLTMRMEWHQIHWVETVSKVAI